MGIKQAKQPMSLVMKMGIALLAMMGAVLVYFAFKLGKQQWLKYNVFDKAEFTDAEKRVLKKWRF
jgi:hypothetical protein